MTTSRLGLAWRLVGSLWVGALASTVASARSHPACEPSTAVRAVLDREAEVAAGCGRSEECWRKRRQVLAEALRQKPLDLFLHRAYQDLFLRSSPESAALERRALADRYRALTLDYPDDPKPVYLLGRLFSEQPLEARRYFSQALRLEGDFPWAHLALALTAPPDGVAVPAGEVASHLGAFRRLCPSRLSEVLSALSGMRGERGLEPILAAARTELRARRDDTALRLWSRLWQEEFQLASGADLEPVRRQVAADLVKIEMRPRADRVEYWHLIIEGRELAKDFDGAASARRELMRRFPCDRQSAELRLDGLEDELPEPSTTAGEEERQSWAQATYVRVRSWSEECPDESMYRSSRFNAAMQWKGLDSVQGLAEIDAMLTRLADREAPTSGGWVEAQAAEFLLERQLDPPRIFALAATLREKAEAARQERLAMKGLPEELRASFELSLSFELWRADKIELRAHLLTKAVPEAWQVLDRMTASLGPEPGTGAEAEQALRLYGVRAAERAALEAELLAYGGATMDALAMYRHGFDLRRKIGGKPTPGELAAARKLWDQLGGGDGVWRTFAAEPAQSTASGEPRSVGWKSLDKPLPELALKDLEGKIWTLADLRGKTTLINIWATWCRPCHLELPHIQELHEQFKDDPNVRVLTLNIDDSVGLVEPFLRRKDYTFPSLFGFDYFAKLSGGMISIPRNWLVSPDGTIRQEMVGFSPEKGEEWRLEVAEKLKAGLEEP